MTKYSYPFGWGAGSKVRGKAESPADYAWNVNFSNGNSNRNNHNNSGFVRAVCGGECQGVTFRQLHAAWREARRGKKPSTNQLTFESCWIDRLLDLEVAINQCTWKPLPPTCFIAPKPKAREIHAPDFADRIVHHWLVPLLESIYELIFIFDSFSNRAGKGTHAAVRRLKDFVRQVEHVTAALLVNSPLHDGVRYACTSAERATIPAHKQLINAAPGCGIAIGNLSSQFFANVYLNELDQFIKHQLKVHRYIRYVDDFVLVHRDPAQLIAWRDQIISFLATRLRLNLKEIAEPKPINGGIDFLGYIVRPTHTLVRKRVVVHAFEAFSRFERQHARTLGRQKRRCMRATPEQFERIKSQIQSYAGHFEHAATHRLQARLHRRFPWLKALNANRRFPHQLRGRYLTIPFEVAA